MQGQLNEMEFQQKQLARRQRKMEYKLTTTSLKSDSRLSLPQPLQPMTKGVFLSFPLFLFSLHWGQCMLLSMGEGI